MRIEELTRNSRDEAVGNEAVPEDQRKDLLPFSLRESDNTPAFIIPRHPVSPTCRPFRGVNASGGIGMLFSISYCHGTYEIRGS